MKVRKIWQLGLIGYPLGHSYSPILHHTALADAGLTGTYRLFPLENETQIPELLQKLRDGELDGLNVTIPYKQTVMAHLDGLTPSAQAIGAVNTISRSGDQLVGDNTDATGFWQDLLSCLSGLDLFGNYALVLGSGGAARSVAYALMSQGWEVTIAARRMAQAQVLAETFNFPNLNTAHWDALNNPSFLKRFSLLVNTTPVGMTPDVGACPLPAEAVLPDGMVVYDLIYNPRQTALMMFATQRGHTAFNGLGMLVHQAALAFEIWTGVPVSVEKMTRAIQNLSGGEEQG